MTTGIMDFIINSGLTTAIAAIPIPDFAVPYAAPKAVDHKRELLQNQPIFAHKCSHR
jgi:hypothetical protein